jgi:peroxiredoxin
VIAAGEQLPEATLWIAPNERVNLREVAADGRVLLVFYLFDWSST